MEKRHTKTVSDLIKSRPKWWIQWGTTGVLLFIIICVSLTSLITYPRIIKKTLTVISLNPFAGEIKLSENEAKVVKPGQKVIIYFSQRILDQKKTFSGYVDFITKAPKESFCTVKVVSQTGERFFLEPIKFAPASITMQAEIFIGGTSVFEHFRIELSKHFL